MIKVECAFPMVIPFKFRMRQHGEGDHQKDASHFSKGDFEWQISKLRISHDISHQICTELTCQVIKYCNKILLLLHFVAIKLLQFNIFA